jgi:RNA polymerase sigma factor (TIGR02999 family)
MDSTDTPATDELLPVVYDELRRLASRRLQGERPDHTLQGTALVHEAYLRLMESSGSRNWNSRRHFFAAAAEAMRRILIESARAKSTRKRGGDRQRVDLQDLVDRGTRATDLLLDIDDGLTRLADEDPDASDIVKLRLFAGFSVADAGQALGMARSTAYENWEFARSWFAVYLDSR